MKIRFQNSGSRSTGSQKAVWEHLYLDLLSFIGFLVYTVLRLKKEVVIVGFPRRLHYCYQVSLMDDFSINNKFGMYNLQHSVEVL